MKIFVTGATGFVGSYFVKKALMEGHEVIALKRSMNAQPKIKLSEQPNWLIKNMENITSNDLKEVDVIVHMAASGVTPQPATWEECYRVNVLETIKFFKTGLSAGVPRFIATGSYAEYGKSGLRYDLIPTTAPLEPTDVYSSSKASSSIALSTLCITEKFEFVYSRLFSVYGEGQNENNFWPALKRAAFSGKDFPMTKGEQIRDYISIEQVVEKLLSHCSAEGIHKGTPKIENLASGHPVTLKSFAEYWWNFWGAKGKLLIGEIPYRENEVMKYVPLIENKENIL